MGFDIGRAVREAERRRPPGGYPKLIGVMPSVRDMPSAREILLEQVNEKRRVLGMAGGVNPFGGGETPAWKRMLQTYQSSRVFSAGPSAALGPLARAGLSTGITARLPAGIAAELSTGYATALPTGFPSWGYSGKWDVNRNGLFAAVAGSTASSLAAMNLTAGWSANWHVRQARASRDAKFQAVMRATNAFGPVVVTPGYEDDAPSGYHPDLQGWLIPETASDPEEFWDELIALVQAIARLHHAEVLLSRLGGGARYVVRVARHPAGAITVGGGAGGAIDYAIGHPIGSVAGTVIGSLITYYLTHR